MATAINIHEAKTHLSRLVEQACAGEEIIIAKAGKPMARLVPLARHWACCRGKSGSPPISMHRCRPISCSPGTRCDMRLLLDTHVLLWALDDPARLGRKTRSLIERSEALVSVASLWEISIKAGLGKLKIEPRHVFDAIEPSGFDLLPVQATHALEVFSLGAVHGDPFDRLLVAQAMSERITLLTFDQALLGYGPSVRLAE